MGYSVIADFFLRWTAHLFSATKTLKFWDGVLLCIAVSIVVQILRGRRKYEITSVSINLPFSLGNITYSASNQDRIVAWKLYVQLKTRKAALIFDENEDVIADVYESLYNIFPLSRDLLTNLPLDEIERKSGVADLVFRVLNDGIRPHLTKWQADYLRWWSFAKEDSHNRDLRPQEIQKGYSKYSELVSELKSANSELNKFADDLLSIAQSNKSKDIKNQFISVPAKPSQEGTPTSKVSGS